MVVTTLSTALLAILIPVRALDSQQQSPLGDVLASNNGKEDLIYELKRAEIIPTVIDTFVPQLTISAFWENATLELGETLDPARLQNKPDVQFIHTVADAVHDSTLKQHPQLTLALSDPDAPSRDNPEWSEICHWILTDVPLVEPHDALPPKGASLALADAPDAADAATAANKEVMPYKPPGPPPKTGKHRYVFVALAPQNGTTERLHLVKPGDRQHWGYESERQGLRLWAEEMGLEVVGANFIYAQNDEQ